MRFIINFCGKRALSILVAVSALALLLDLLSIALIFPFLQLFISPEIIRTNMYLQMGYQLSGAGTPEQFILAIGLVLLLAYLLKLGSKTALNKIRYDYTDHMTFRLTTALFEGLLKSRYSLFTSESTSEMVGIITSHTVRSMICLDAWITILNEAAFFAVMIAAFLVVGPLVTLSLLIIFAFIGLLLYLGLVKRIGSYGQIHSRLNLLVYKFAFTVASTIKDIKIMGLETKYRNRFDALWKEYSENDAKTKTVKNIPKDFAETLVFSAIIAVCLYVLVTHGNLVELIPMLGVLGVSTMRFLPSFTKIFNSYNEYKYYRNSLSVVEDLSVKLAANQQISHHQEIPFSSNLRISGLNFQYDDKIVLDSIDLEIKKGSSVAFVGLSGSGKSTLLDILAGLQEPNSGEFYLDGTRFDPFQSDALRSRLGYVPQSVTLVDESVAYNIAFDEEHDVERLKRVIEMARLGPFVDALPNGLETLLGESGVRVSGGQKQRIGIARALYREPQILVFDEATSALDNITERELMQEINALSRIKTLIIVAHRLTTVEQCDVIYLLDGGRLLAEGSHSELLSSSADYRRLYFQQASAT